MAKIKDVRFSIVLEKSKGLGDILFAKKILDILAFHYPMIASRIFAVDKEAKEGLRKFNIRAPVWKDIYFKFKKTKNLIIHCPVLEKKVELPNEKSILWHITAYSPVIPQNLSAENFTIIKSGLGKDAAGIFFNEKLYDYMSFLYKNNKDYDLSCLGNLKKKALRDFFFKERDYENADSLFFGYCTRLESALNFAKLCAKFEKSKNIDICVCGKRTKKDLKRFYSLLGNQKEMFANENIGAMEILCFDQKKSARFISLKNNKKRKLAFLFTGHLNHSDIIQLLKAAHSIALVTGDQSLSEALSAGKILIIEPHVHQTKFITNLCEHANAINPDFYKFILFSSWYLMKEIDFEIKNIDMLKNDFKKLSSSIYLNANFENTLCKMIDFLIKTAF